MSVKGQAMVQVADCGDLPSSLAEDTVVQFTSAEVSPQDKIPIWSMCVSSDDCCILSVKERLIFTILKAVLPDALRPAMPSA